MLFRKTMVAYCKNHIKRINKFCEKNAEFLFVKPSGKVNNYWALNNNLEIISKVMLFFAIQIA
jgi:hypothetical protein